VGRRSSRRRGSRSICCDEIECKSCSGFCCNFFFFYYYYVDSFLLQLRDDGFGSFFVGKTEIAPNSCLQLLLDGWKELLY
jgi:hypothetical protein